MKGEGGGGSEFKKEHTAAGESGNKCDGMY